MKLGEVPILDTLKKIPGGIMFIPLLVGATINTFFPALVDPKVTTTIAGSLWVKWFKEGALCLIAMLLVCTGAQISFKSSPMAFYKGMVINFSKVILGVVPAMIVGRLYGPTGTVCGLSALALVNMSNSNGGLYGGLVSHYGDKEDLGALAIISTNDGPFYEMCSLAGAGVAVIPWQMLLATIAPVLFGMLLGNLDKKMAKFLEPGIFISIFLFSFPLGCGLNFGKAIAAGGPGVLLALLTLLITGVGGYFLYMIFIPKKHRVTCVPGAAVGSIAGNAVATPAAIASADPRFAPVLESATIQVVAAILICAVCCPILCNFLFKLEEKATGHKINLEGVDYTEEEHKI